MDASSPKSYLQRLSVIFVKGFPGEQGKPIPLHCWLLKWIQKQACQKGIPTLSFQQLTVLLSSLLSQAIKNLLYPLWYTICQGSISLIGTSGPQIHELPRLCRHWEDRLETNPGHEHQAPPPLTIIQLLLPRAGRCLTNTYTAIHSLSLRSLGMSLTPRQGQTIWLHNKTTARGICLMVSDSPHISLEFTKCQHWRTPKVICTSSSQMPKSWC